MSLIIFILLSLMTVINAENVLTSQVFVIPIKTDSFGWDIDGRRNQISYEPSLLNAPDLPSWIYYTYSKRNGEGFLYGVAPKGQKDIQLEVVSLNKHTYETRYKILDIDVHEKENPAKYEVELKIDNLNVEDILDQNKTETLLNVFRKKLWVQATDVYVTFLASAVVLGARLPLKPEESEGFVIRIGSSHPFSQELYDLQKQLKPLRKWTPSSCPRQFTRTTVETSFREPGFVLNWCYFRLYEDNDQGLQRESARHGLHVVRYSSSEISGRMGWRWSRLSRADVPNRSYFKEVVTEIIVLVVVFLALGIQFFAAFCLQHEEPEKREQGIIKEHCTNEIQMVQYASSKKSTLRSLSTHPSSPNEALLQSPRISTEHNNPFIRPNPPPYNGQYNLLIKCFCGDLRFWEKFCGLLESSNPIAATAQIEETF